MTDVAAFGLLRTQIEQLVRPINPRRVYSAQGQSHVAAFDVIAHLTRVFGVGGWSFEIVSLDLVHERSTTPDAKNIKDQGRWWVTYRCVGRLIIRNLAGNEIARFEDAATGSAQNMPSPGDAHDFAVKNAVSYTIKRCAKNLGDQFGLSLYNKGSRDALIGATLVLTSEDVEQHAQAPQTIGNDEVESEHVERLAAVPSDDPFYSDAGRSGEAAPASVPPAGPRRPHMDSPDGPPTKAQMGMLGALLKGQTRDQALAVVSSIVGRDVASRDELTKAETSRVIDALKKAEAAS